MYASAATRAGKPPQSSRVTAAGGEVLGEPMLIPAVGHYVSFIDTEGNRNSMLQPVMG